MQLDSDCRLTLPIAHRQVIAARQAPCRPARDVALEVVDLAVVQQPIDERGSERGVVEHPPRSVRLLFEVMIVAFFSSRVAMTS